MPDPSGFEIPGIGGEAGPTLPGPTGAAVGGFEIPGLGGEAPAGIDQPADGSSVAAQSGMIAIFFLTTGVN